MTYWNFLKNDWSMNNLDQINVIMDNDIQKHFKSWKTCVCRHYDSFELKKVPGSSDCVTYLFKLYSTKH